MKDLLAKLIRIFHQPEPQKPVDPWPFPKVSEDFEPREKCCGGCNKPAKKPAKPIARKKPAAKKIAVKKATKQPAKKASK